LHARYADAAKVFRASHSVSCNVSQSRRVTGRVAPFDAGGEGVESHPGGESCTIVPVSERQVGTRLAGSRDSFLCRETSGTAGRADCRAITKGTYDHCSPLAKRTAVQWAVTTAATSWPARCEDEAGTGTAQPKHGRPRYHRIRQGPARWAGTRLISFMARPAAPDMSEPSA